MDDIRHLQWRLILVVFGVVSLLAAGLLIGHGGGRSVTAATPQSQGGDPDAATSGNAFSAVGAQQAYARSFPSHGILPGLFRRGVHQADRMERSRLQDGWQELGPTYAPNADFPNPKNHASSSVSGRVNAIAADPSTCDTTHCGTMYVGTSGGGVWKTTDGGQTWAALTDAQVNIAIGALALDPQNPNIIYAGTGDPGHSTSSDRGIGILRSTDGGQNWDLLAYDQFHDRSISAIIVDPRTAGSTNATLYVASTIGMSGSGLTSNGYLAPTRPNKGFYVSTDGGQTWTQSNPQGVSTDGVDALTMDPSDPNTLYAGFEQLGVFKSTDDGQSWILMNNGMPKDGFNDVTVALAASNPATVYAAINNDKNPEGEIFFRSDDSGQSWTQRSNTPNACSKQCFGNMHIAVDPGNADVVYAGGTANYGYLHNESGTQNCATLSPLAANCNASLMKSTDGGQTWADIAENGNGAPIHPDNHVIWISPAASSVVYAGNDGGIFHSADGGQTWDDLNKGLGTILAQSVSVGSDGRIYMGAQDNGTFMFNGSGWVHVGTGDGGQTAVDPKNPRTSYSTRYGSQLLRNDSSGDPNKNIWIAPFFDDHDILGRGQFYEPFVVSPSNPNDIYYGTYRVWRSKMRGGKDGNHDGDATNDRHDKTDWTPISFDLTCNAQPAGASDTCDSKDNAGQGISAIAVSPTNPNIVAAATATGNIWLTTNALARVKTSRACTPWKNRHGSTDCDFVSGVQWIRIDSGLPKRFVSSLHFAPGSATSLLVTFSAYDEDTQGNSGHVFATTNSGQSWINLNGTGNQTSLPDLPFNDVLFNPSNGHIYASADYGIYMSTDGAVTWSRIDGGLPSAPTFQMTLSSTGALVMATFGRGVWQMPAP